jgi:ribosome-binding protein aMBF1 (putative translation factor)
MRDSISSLIEELVGTLRSATEAVEEARGKVLILRHALRKLRHAPFARKRGRRDLWPVDPARFGLAVRRARETQGLSREELSVRAGLAASTIRNVETNRHVPTDRIRQRLIGALETAAQRIGPPPEWDRRDLDNRSSKR